MKNNNSKNAHRVLSTAMLITMLGTTFTPTIVNAVSLNKYIEESIEVANEELKEINSEEIQESKNDDITYNLSELVTEWEKVYQVFNESSTLSSFIDYLKDNYSNVNLRELYDSIKYYYEDLNIDIDEEEVEKLKSIVKNNLNIDADNLDNMEVKDIEIIANDSEARSDNNANKEQLSIDINTDINSGTSYTMKNNIIYNTNRMPLIDNDSNYSNLINDEYIQIVEPGYYSFETNIDVTSSNVYVDICTNFYEGDLNEITMPAGGAGNCEYNYVDYNSSSSDIRNINVTQEMVDNGFYYYIYATRDVSGGYSDRYIKFDNTTSYINVKQYQQIDITDNISYNGENSVNDFYYNITDNNGNVIMTSAEENKALILYPVGITEDYILNITFNEDKMKLLKNEDGYTYTITIHPDGTYEIDRDIILYKKTTDHGVQVIKPDSTSGNSLKTTGQNNVSLIEDTENGTGDFLKVSGSKIYITQPGVYEFDYNINLLARSYLSNLYLEFGDDVTSTEHQSIYLNTKGLGTDVGNKAGEFTYTITQEMVDNNVYFILRSQGTSTYSSRYSILDYDTTFINVNKLENTSIVDIPIINDNDYDFTYVISNNEFTTTSNLNTLYSTYKIFNQDETSLELVDGTYYYQLISQDATTRKDSNVYKFTVTNGEISYTNAPTLEQNNNTITAQLDSKDNNLIRQHSTDTSLNADIESKEDNLFVNGSNGKIYFSEPGMYTLNYNIDVYAESSLEAVWFNFGDDIKASTTYWYQGNSMNVSVDPGVTTGSFDFYISEEMVSNNTYINLWSSSGSGDWGQYNASNTYFEFIKQDNINEVTLPINIEDDLGTNFVLTTYKPNDHKDMRKEMSLTLSSNEKTVFLEDGVYYVQAAWQDSALVKDDTIYKIEIKDGVVISDDINYYKNENTLTARYNKNHAHSSDMFHEAVNSNLNISIDTATDNNFVSGQDGKFYFNEAGLYNVKFNVDVIEENSLDNLWIQIGDDTRPASVASYSMYNKYFAANVGIYNDKFSLYITDEMVKNNAYITFYSCSGSADWGRYDASNTYVEFEKVNNNVNIPVINDTNNEVPYVIYQEHSSSSVFTNKNIDQMVTSSVIASDDKSLDLDLMPGEYYLTQKGVNKGVKPNDTKYYFTVDNNGIISMKNTPTFEPSDNTFIAGYEIDDHEISDNYEFNMQEINDDSNIATIHSDGYITFDKAGVYDVTLHFKKPLSQSVTLYAKTAMRGKATTNIDNNLGNMNAADEYSFTVNISEQDIANQSYSFIYNSSSAGVFYTNGTYIEVKEREEDVSNLDINVVDSDGNPVSNLDLDVLQLRGKSSSSEGQSAVTTKVTTDEKGNANLNVLNDNYIISDLNNTGEYLPFNESINVDEDKTLNITLENPSENVAVATLSPDDKYLNYVSSGLLPFEIKDSREWLTVQSNNTIRINEPGYYNIKYSNLASHGTAISYVKYANTTSSQDRFDISPTAKDNMNEVEFNIYVTQDMIDNNYVFSISNIKQYNHTPNTFVRFEKIDENEYYNSDKYDNSFVFGTAFFDYNNLIDNNKLAFETLSNNEDITSDNVSLTINKTGNYAVDFSLISETRLSPYGTDYSYSAESDKFIIYKNDEILYSNDKFSYGQNKPTHEIKFDNVIYLEAGDVISFSNPKFARIHLKEGFIGFNYIDETDMNNISIQTFSVDDEGVQTKLPEGIKFEFDMQVREGALTKSIPQGNITATTNEDGVLSADLSDGIYDVELTEWTSGYSNNLESLGTIKVKDGEIVEADDIVLTEIENDVLLTVPGNVKDNNTMKEGSGKNLEFDNINESSYVYQNNGQYYFTETGRYTVTMNFDLADGTTSDIQSGVNPYNTGSWNDRGNARCSLSESICKLSYEVIVTQDMIDYDYRIYNYAPSSLINFKNNTSYFEIKYEESLNDYYKTLPVDNKTVYAGAFNIGSQAYIWDANADFVDMSTYYENPVYAQSNDLDNKIDNKTITIQEDGVYNIDMLLNLNSRKSNYDFVYNFYTSKIVIYKNSTPIYTFDNQTLKNNDYTSLTFNESLELVAGDKITVKSTGGNQVFADYGSYINITTENEMPTGNITFSSKNDTPMGSVTLVNTMTNANYKFNLDENTTVEVPEGEYSVTHSPIKYYTQDTFENLVVVKDENIDVEINTDIIQTKINVVAHNEKDEEVSMLFDIYQDSNFNEVIDEEDIVYTTDTTSSLLRAGKTINVPANQYIIKFKESTGYSVNTYSDELVIDATEDKVYNYRFKLYSDDVDFYNLGGKHGANRSEVAMQAQDVNTGNTHLEDGNTIAFDEPGLYEFTMKSDLIGQYGLAVQDWGYITLNEDKSTSGYYVTKLSGFKSDTDVVTIKINITQEMIDNKTTLSWREYWKAIYSSYSVTYSKTNTYITVKRLGDITDTIPSEVEDYDFVRYTYNENNTVNVYNNATPLRVAPYSGTLFKNDGIRDSYVQILNTGTYEFKYNLRASSRYSRSFNYNLNIYNESKELLDTINIGDVSYVNPVSGSIELSLNKGEYISVNSSNNNDFNGLLNNSYIALDVVDLEGKELSVSPISTYDDSILNDSVFGVYDENNIKVAELSNGNNFTTNRVANGNYKIKQEKSNEGYIMSKDINVTIDGELSVDIYNDIIKSDYRAKVKTVGTDASIMDMKWDIYNSKGEVVDQLVMSSDGQYLELDTLDYLIYGNYTLEEVNNPNGYIPSSQSEFTRSFKISKNQEMFTDTDVMKYKEGLFVAEAVPGRYSKKDVVYKALNDTDFGNVNENKTISVSDDGVYKLYINTSLSERAPGANMVYYMGNTNDEFDYVNIAEADVKDWDSIITVPENERFLIGVSGTQYVVGDGITTTSSSYIAFEKLNEDDYNNVETTNENTVFKGKSYDDKYYTHTSVDEKIPFIANDKKKATEYVINEEGTYNVEFNISGKGRTSSITATQHASMSANSSTWLQIDRVDGTTEIYNKYSKGTYADPYYKNSGEISKYLNKGDIVSLHSVNNVNLLIVDDASLTINKRSGTGILPEVKPTEPWITGSDYAYIYEQSEITDKQLYELFNIDSNEIAPFRTLSIEHTINPNVAGKYNIDFIITDNFTNKTVVHKSELEIIDRMPVITGVNEITITLGNTIDDYIEAFDVNATEITYGDLNSTITVNSDDIKYYKTGSYNIIFTAKDSEGNEVNYNAILNIVRDDIDTTPITPEIDKANPTLEVNSYFATAEETILTNEELIDAYNPKGNYSDDSNRELTIDSSLVNYSSPGKYPITFTNNDLDTNISISETVIIEILDLKPNINSDLEKTVYVGDEIEDYKELFNVTATEKDYNDLYDNVSVDYSQVDLDNRGAYNISFIVSDEENNIVKTNAYLIVAENYVSYPEGVKFDDEELYAEFVGEEVLEERDEVELISNDIKFNSPGVYPVTFSYYDADNKYVTFKAMYEVTDVLPIISADDIEIYLGDNIDNYIETFNVNAMELKDNDLNGKVTYDDSEVDYSKTGTYPVVFSVSDNEMNKVSTTTNLTINRDIIEVNPITPEVSISDPLIEMTNDYYSTNELKDNVEITDEELIEIYGVTTNIVPQTNRELLITHNIDLEAPGEYEVTFTNKDTSLDKEVSKTATYEVIDVLPTIEADDITIEVGTKFDLKNNLSIQASEFNNNDLIDAVNIDDSNVDYNTAGKYNIVLTVTDEEGNEAVTTIIITIVDNSESEVKIVEDIENFIDNTIKSEVTIVEKVTNRILENTGITLIFPIITAVITSIIILIKKRK